MATQRGKEIKPSMRLAELKVVVGLKIASPPALAASCTRVW